MDNIPRYGKIITFSFKEGCGRVAFNLGTVGGYFIECTNINKTLVLNKIRRSLTSNDVTASDTFAIASSQPCMLQSNGAPSEDQGEDLDVLTRGTI